MPPRLSARQVLWSGVILTALGVFVENYLGIVVVGAGGSDALNSDWWFVLAGIVGPVAVPVGTVLIACSSLVRIVELGTRPGGSETDRMPPRFTARRLAWAGLVLIVVGLVLSFLPAFSVLGGASAGLSGGTDLSSNLARDLMFVAGPVASLALPLGVALLPCSLVAKVLETRAGDRLGKTVAVLGRP
jgi:hypothetical protein